MVHPQVVKRALLQFCRAAQGFVALVRKGVSKPVEKDAVDLEALASLLYGIYGADVIEKVEQVLEKSDTVEKAWRSEDHPRGKDGRFIPKGSTEARTTASDEVRKAIRGDRSSSPQKLMSHLALLTVKQIRELAKEHGKKVPSAIKANLMESLRALVGGAATPIVPHESSRAIVPVEEKKSQAKPKSDKDKPVYNSGDDGKKNGDVVKESKMPEIKTEFEIGNTQVRLDRSRGTTVSHKFTAGPAAGLELIGGQKSKVPVTPKSREMMDVVIFRLGEQSPETKAKAARQLSLPPGKDTIVVRLSTNPDMAKAIEQANEQWEKSISEYRSEARRQIESGERMLEVKHHEGEYTSGYFVSGGDLDATARDEPEKLLKSLGVIEEIDGWGTRVNSEMVKDLGRKFTFEQAKEWADKHIRPRREAEKARIEERDREKVQRREEAISRAKSTGSPVLISTESFMDSRPEDESDVTIVELWAMPDGSVQRRESLAH